jgi:hypothetical protein
VVTNPNVEPGARRDLWLALLRRLTQTSPTFLVWKNVESALEGQGDIDAAAATRDWDAIEEQFLDWATELELLPAALCHHIPGGRNLIAAPAGTRTFFELSIKHDKAFRGSTLFVLDDLLAMSEMDDRGFRRLRPGAEGLLKMVLNGSKWFGRPDRDGLTGKRVRELLASDPEGFAMAARVFGRADAAARRLAQAVVDGRWDRRAMCTIEGHALLKGLRHPSVMARRAWFRLTMQRRCPVVYAIGHGRVVSDPRDAWLADVARSHVLHEARV